MTSTRYFCWIEGLRGPEPQIVYLPLVGSVRSKIIAGTEHDLDRQDKRTLWELARAFPAPPPPPDG